MKRSSTARRSRSSGPHPVTPGIAALRSINLRTRLRRRARQLAVRRPIAVQRAIAAGARRDPARLRAVAGELTVAPRAVQAARAAGALFDAVSPRAGERAARPVARLVAVPARARSRAGGTGRAGVLAVVARAAGVVARRARLAGAGAAVALEGARSGSAGTAPAGRDQARCGQRGEEAMQHAARTIRVDRASQQSDTGPQRSAAAAQSRLATTSRLR